MVDVNLIHAMELLEAAHAHQLANVVMEDKAEIIYHLEAFNALAASIDDATITYEVNKWPGS